MMFSLLLVCLLVFELSTAPTNRSKITKYPAPILHERLGREPFCGQDSFYVGACGKRSLRRPQREEWGARAPNKIAHARQACL